MNVESVSAFLMWCTVINGSLLVFWTCACILLPDTVYQLQSKWFAIPREKYDLVMYSLLGLFKVMFLIFNLVPYLAIQLIS